MNRVTAPGEALGEAVDLAARICRNGPVAVRETMRILDGLNAGPDELGWQLTEAAEVVIRSSTDTIEGVEAFFERRDPRWTGR